MSNKKNQPQFFVMYENKIIARYNSMREMARQLPINKSHIWYSRKFREHNGYFLFIFEGETYYIQKL